MVKLGERVIPKTVESVTLTELLDMAKDETVGLLKMDCEGCEYSVLNNLEREAFERIEAIFMEYHNGLQNLKSILESNGFQVEVIGKIIEKWVIYAPENYLVHFTDDKSRD